jgi:hypothetical protein
MITCYHIFFLKTSHTALFVYFYQCIRIKCNFLPLSESLSLYCWECFKCLYLVPLKGSVPVPRFRRNLFLYYTTERYFFRGHSEHRNDSNRLYDKTRLTLEIIFKNRFPLYSALILLQSQLIHSSFYSVNLMFIVGIKECNS